MPHKTIVISKAKRQLTRREDIRSSVLLQHHYRPDAELVEAGKEELVYGQEYGKLCGQANGLLIGLATVMPTAGILLYFFIQSANVNALILLSFASLPLAQTSAQTTPDLRFYLMTIAVLGLLVYPIILLIYSFLFKKRNCSFRTVADRTIITRKPLDI